MYIVDIDSKIIKTIEYTQRLNFKVNPHREKICIRFTAYEEKYLQLRKSYLSQITRSLLLRSGSLK